jgi:hypothetical protein
MPANTELVITILAAGSIWIADGQAAAKNFCSRSHSCPPHSTCCGDVCMHPKDTCCARLRLIFPDAGFPNSCPPLGGHPTSCYPHGHCCYTDARGNPVCT